MTTWITFRIEYDEGMIDRVRVAFNSRMTDILQGSDLNALIEEMFTHMKTQIEKPALANSGFTVDEVQFMDINFYQLNLTQGSSHFPLPRSLVNKGAIVNPKNKNDEECFKWAVIAALHHEEIKYHPERISNIVKFEDHYDWDGSEFPLPIKRISKFE